MVDPLKIELDLPLKLSKPSQRYKPIEIGFRISPNGVYGESRLLACHGWSRFPWEI
jgi:hypothetical protein